MVFSRLDPWADLRVTGEVRKVADRVEAVMVGNPYAVAVWHHGFITTFHCGGHAMSAEVVNRLGLEPLEEVLVTVGVLVAVRYAAFVFWMTTAED